MLRNMQPKTKRGQELKILAYQQYKDLQIVFSYNDKSVNFYLFIAVCYLISCE